MSRFITSCVLCAALFITPAAVFVFQKTDTLEVERRKIAEFPDVPEKIRARDIKRFFNGFDVFFADHFPLRDALLSLSIGLHEATSDSLDMDKCYRGKKNWLFLGNGYGRCVDKLQGIIALSGTSLQRQAEDYIQKHEAARQIGAEFVIFIGPNKSSIYSEYLPPVITPAPKRFITPLVESLRSAGVKIYDPTERLISRKNTGLLYYRTDTHWNGRGAYEAFEGFREYVGLPELPALSFMGAEAYRGDLVDIGGFKRFPLSKGDTAAARWDIPVPHAVSGKTAWIFSDSFIGALSPYIAVTFAKIKFFSQHEFEAAMSSTYTKPDIIIWVIVERNFAN